MKTLALVLAVVFHAALAFPQVPGTPPRSGDRGTLRLDYYHTGNAREERFSVDRVVREPLPWPGNAARPIDATNRGKYFFEVADLRHR